MKASRIVAFALCVMLAAMSAVIVVGAVNDLISFARQSPNSESHDVVDSPDIEAHPMAPLAKVIEATLYGIIFVVCLIVCSTGIVCSLVNIVAPCEVGWVRTTSICALAVNSLALLLVIIDLFVR